MKERRGRMRNKLLLRNQNKGSAMIVAIAASLITMVLSLSLLLLSYSVFFSATREASKMQCKEMAYSISQELQNEITVNFNDYEEQRLAFESGKNPLWFFVRYHIWQGNDWPYFNADESQHSSSLSYRYFKLRSAGNEIDQCADQILVTMYWDGSEDTQSSGAKDGTVLHIRVEVFKGDEYFANNMSFSLEVTDYEGVPDGTVDKNGDSLIVATEKWKWVKE